MKRLLVGLLVVGGLFAQVFGPTKKVRRGTSDPATCNKAEVFFNETSNVLKVCTASDTWSTLGASDSHTQNTDTGTTSGTFQLDSGNTGPKLKNNALTLESRNAADNAYAPIRASEFLTDSTSAGEYKFYEAAAGGSNYVSVGAPAALDGNLKLVFPNANPAGSVLVYPTPAAGVSAGSFYNVVTSVATPGSDTQIATEKAVRDAITASGGETTRTHWQSPANTYSQNVWTTTANTVKVYSFYLPYPVQTSEITFRVGTGDNTACSGGTHCYSIGIVEEDGDTVLSTAAFGTTSNGTFYTKSWTQGATTLSVGHYNLALTGTDAVMTVGVGNAEVWTGRVNVGTTVSTGGVMPAAVVFPANSWATANIPWFVLK